MTTENQRKKKDMPIAEVRAGGGAPQIASGEHARNIQSETYIENYGAQVSSLDALHQLPSPPADFTGREKEIREIIKDIKAGAIISGLQGMGGIGKTALGLIVAHNLKDLYSEGQIYLDLRGAHKQEPMAPTEAMSQVLRSFDREAKLPDDEATLTSLYCSVLQGKNVLFFFDNARGQEQVTPLLPPPGSITLVTSRQHFNLPGLTVHNLDTLAPKDARALVRKIAKGVKAEEADIIAKQCGYLPLALRLAAGMLATRTDWTPADLTKKLQNTLKLLGPVEASLELSYRQLDDAIKLHFRQLGVFPAPFDRKAAGAIWETDEEETDKLLGVLLQASLLEYNRDSNRYELHDLLGDFTLARLSGDEKKAASLRHAEQYMRVLSNAGDLYSKGGDKLLAGLALFDQEAVHIKTGQAWAAKNRAELGNVYPSVAAFLLDLRLTPSERITWQEDALTAARQLEDKMGESQHLCNLGIAYLALGESRKAIEFYEKAFLIAREIGDRRGEGAAQGNMGAAYAALGETHKAIEFYEKQLEIAHETGDRYGEGNSLGNLGIAYAALGETRKAIEFYEKALLIKSEIGNRRGEGIGLFNLGIAYVAVGENRKAIECYEKALLIAREIGDRREEGAAQGNMGAAYVVLGENRKAIELYEKSMVIAREIGDRLSEGIDLGNLGNALYQLGQKEKGIALMKQAIAIFEEIKSPNAEWARNNLKEWGEEGIDEGKSV